MCTVVGDYTTVSYHELKHRVVRLLLRNAVFDGLSLHLIFVLWSKCIMGYSLKPEDL